MFARGDGIIDDVDRLRPDVRMHARVQHKSVRGYMIGCVVVVLCNITQVQQQHGHTQHTQPLDSTEQRSVLNSAELDFELMVKPQAG